MRKTKPLRMRFESKLRVTPGCWLWLASTGNSGYGKIKAGTRYISVHRLAYQLYVGSVPEGMHVLHRCDNRVCVNPDHLFIGTRLANMQDMTEKNRSTAGEKHPGVKLTESEVRAIRADSRSLSVLSSRYGVSISQIGRIKRGERWTHLSGPAKQRPGVSA